MTHESIAVGAILAALAIASLARLVLMSREVESQLHQARPLEPVPATTRPPDGRRPL